MDGGRRVMSDSPLYNITCAAMMNDDDNNDAESILASLPSHDGNFMSTNTSYTPRNTPSCGNHTSTSD